MLLTIGFFEIWFWILWVLILAFGISLVIVHTKWREEKLRANTLAVEKTAYRAMLTSRISDGIQQTLAERYEDLKHHGRGPSGVDEVRWRLIEQDLHDLYHQQVVNLRLQYPDLTDVDITFILLLAIGVDNPDIALLLQMEKRSIYRRRQLIAQRMNISSLELDNLIRDRFL